MAWVYQLFIAVLFLSNLSCQGQKAADRDPLADSNQKIDKGDYDGAIAQLEELRTKDARPLVKSALASAYAGRAGLKVEKLWDFVKALNAPPVTEESVKKSSVFLQSQDVISKNALVLGKGSENELEQLAQSMAAFQEYRLKIESLPYIPQNKRNDLRLGAAVLKDADSKGAHLYRAILNLVFLRSELQDGFKYWGDVSEELKKLDSENRKNPKNKQILCSVKISEFQDWLDQQFDRVTDISEDLRFSFPSKSEEMIAFDKSIKKYQDEVPRLEHTLFSNSKECR